MPDQFSIRAVIDTNVLFEGLTKQGGICGLIVDAWLAGLFRPCVSNALAYEYIEVLSSKLSHERWQKIRLVLEKLLKHVEFIAIYFTWRPNSPDPGDEHLIDCAMNAGATIVTFNLKDFQLAKRELGLQVISPIEYIALLSSRREI